MSCCTNHPEAPATAYCRECGKPLCQSCQRAVGAAIYCAEHEPARAAAAPAAAPAPNAGVSPGLAFLLGLIPGVGAIYNAQYAKGLVHVVVWGLLVSITSSGAASGLEPLFGMLTAAWIFYMAFEAYHTAKKRLLGQPVDEFSSLVPLKGPGTRFPVAPVVLIAVGVIFLLNNLEIVRLHQVLRYWPVFLIVLGVYMLYGRLGGDDDPAAPKRPLGTEAGNEQ